MSPRVSAQTRREARAEVAKLARLLGERDPEALAFVARASPDELRRYRDQVTDLLYDDGAALAQRAGDAARLLPAQVIARIATQALGPLLSARLAGQLHPRLAVQVTERVDASFLAELAAELDPRRAAEVIASVPPDLMVEVAVLMAGNGEHVAMGRFVGHLDADALAACVAALAPQDLLRIAFVLEGKERIDDVIACLDDTRAAGLPACAAEHDLEDELADLVSHLGKRQRARVTS
jgi:hypothetical protein